MPAFAVEDAEVVRVEGQAIAVTRPITTESLSAALLTQLRERFAAWG